MAPNGHIPRPKGVLTLSQKLARREAWASLSKDVAEAQLGYTDLATTIAVKHGRSVSWTRSQLYLGSRKLMKKRKAIPWNGFLRTQLQEANAERVGPKWKLPEYVKAHGPELQASYARLSAEERDAYRVEVEELRAMKTTMARENPKAVLKDVDSTFDGFQREFHAVEQRTGCKAFYIAVRGDVEHHNEPKVYMAPETIKFFKEVLNIEPKKLAMQYKAFIVGGSQGVVKSHKKAITEDISECRTLIADGLDFIVKKHKMPTNVKTAAKLMNYINYEKRVVEQFGVELKGWPCEVFKNPGTLRRDELAMLLAELGAGRCHWVKLSEEELRLRIESNRARQMMGDKVYTARKVRMDKAMAPAVDIAMTD